MVTRIAFTMLVLAVAIRLAIDLFVTPLDVYSLAGVGEG